MTRLTWRALNDQLIRLSEEEVAALLNDELTLHKRPSFIERLHQRYAKLRSDRERESMLIIVKDPHHEP